MTSVCMPLCFAYENRVLSEKREMSDKSCTAQEGLESLYGGLPNICRPIPRCEFPPESNIEKAFTIQRQVDSHDKYFTGSAMLS